MATSYLAPGVYVEELATGSHVIEAVGTSIAGFVGRAPSGDAQVNELVACSSWTMFASSFAPPGAASNALSHAVFGFFNNGGSYCYVVNVGAQGSLADGLRVLDQTDAISIVVCPGFEDVDSYEQVITHCETRKDRFAILETPPDVSNVNQLVTVATSAPTASAPAASGPPGGPAAGTAAGRAARDTSTAADTAAPSQPPPRRPRNSSYAAVYYPRILVADPLAPAVAGQPRPRSYISPSGHMAGIYARSDASRGVHKAPANEAVRGALGLERLLTRGDQEILNPAGVNVIRFFAAEGIRAYGARTLDLSNSEWKYINVRRIFIMLEQSIARGTQWVVFEPNDASLWKSIRRDVTAFLNLIWRSGALMGRTASEAFFVKCDEETNPPESIEAGRVVIMIGVAPVRPAEFVIFRIGQHASGANIES